MGFVSLLRSVQQLHSTLHCLLALCPTSKVAPLAAHFSSLSETSSKRIRSSEVDLFLTGHDRAGTDDGNNKVGAVPSKHYVTTLLATTRPSIHARDNVVAVVPQRW
jgi:hypothetical protein